MAVLKWLPTFQAEAGDQMRAIAMPEWPLKVFTFLCVRSDGSVPAMELSLWPDEVAAQERAEALLVEHRTCNAVEVWDEDVLFASVTQTSGSA